MPKGCDYVRGIVTYNTLHRLGLRVSMIGRRRQCFFRKLKRLKLIRIYPVPVYTANSARKDSPSRASNASFSLHPQCIQQKWQDCPCYCGAPRPRHM